MIDNEELFREIQILRGEIAAFTDQERESCSRADHIDAESILRSVLEHERDIHTFQERRAQLQMSALPRHLWLKVFIKDLETNPHAQYRVHLIGTWYWVINFPLVAALFFGFPDLWVSIGLLLNTFYSLYANFATDYGAVSAALAAMRNGAMPRVKIPEPVDNDQDGEENADGTAR